MSQNLLADSSTTTLIVPCEFGGPDHEYPSDWVFGGANGKHPGADPRFESRNYTYWSEDVHEVFVTSTPICDDEAIDMFTWVANLGKNFNPVRVSVRVGAKGKEVMLPVAYDKATDVARDL